MTRHVLPVWWDDAADGPGNMAADELLADEAERRGRLVVRIYGWSMPTVSLGGFQRLAEAEACAAIAGLPIVRRPSGGGAIIHGTDLTYAAAVPKTHPWGATPQALYDAMHAAMAAALAEFGIAARLHVPSAADPPADAFLCFSRRAPGDLVAAPPGNAGADPSRTDSSTAVESTALDGKIMGSAQRRLGTAVLQHGSLLLETCTAVGPAAQHAGLADVAKTGSWTARQIAERWLDRVAAALEIARESQPRPFREGREAAIEDRAARFRDPRWTGRR